MLFQNHLDICREFIARLSPGDVVIDATMANGRDTLALRRAVGPEGRVYAFDIQPQALEHTRRRLEEAGVPEGVELILDSHARLDRYVTGSVKGVFFNLGYLPGGDHAIFTRPDSTIAAIEKALPLLSEDGFVSVLIYHGGDTGFEERDQLLAYLRLLDGKRYTVLEFHYSNRPNCPPIPVLIQKCGNEK